MQEDESTLRFNQCEEARLRVLRGDGVIGIMPVAEIEQMVAMYKTLGASGMADAWLGLARYHLDPSGLDCSPTAAAEYAGAAILLGSTAARPVLRNIVVQLRMEDGDDPPNAAAVFTSLDGSRAADRDGDAAYHAGLLAFHGYGTAKSATTSVKLHEEAAEKGNADAMFELYVLHATGQGTTKDEATALMWCEKAAAKGQPRACFNLGAFYATGNGVELDEAKAFEWYGRASNAGHGKATATMAYMTIEGSGCEPSPERAEELFELAASQGFDVETFRDQLGV